TQDIFPQHNQSHTRLSVGNHAKIGRIGYVRVSINAFSVFVGQPADKSSGLIQGGRIFSVVELQSTVMVDESVKAFVHPSISALIGTHNHGEPVMAKLMVGNSPQPIPFAFIAAEVQAGIFHSSDISGHVYGHRIGIFVPPFRVMFYRSFAVFCGSSPSVLSITFLWISGLGQGFFTTRKVDFGGIPDKCFGRAKSHIPRVLYAKFPSKCSFLFWTRSEEHTSEL